MKKVLSVCLLALLMFSFAGCGAEEVKTVNLNQVITDINAKYPSQMKEIGEVETLKSYYNIAPEDIESFAVEMDMSGIDEIILIKAANADAVPRIEACLKDRYNAKLKQGASYSPEEMDTIRSCKVEIKGNYVSMIVSEDAEGMTEIYHAAFA